MRTTISALVLAAIVAWTPAVQGAQATQTTFASPEDAVAALVKAVRANDRKATLAVLGQDAASFVPSGDRVADRATAKQFLDSFDARNTIARDGDRATLTIGTDGYPFAFPIVKTGDRWRFDTAAGREEMLARRIGENELSAIEVLRAIADAQVEYASEDRNGNGSLEYAQRIASSPGKRDGLYWRAKPGEPASPLGLLVASATGQGYGNDKGPQPYHGYYFKALKGQGADAPTGKRDYVVRGRAIGGYGVVAWPAKYANSGVMTFIINHEGVVYEQDLGPETSTAVAAMTRFNPGKGWTKVPTR
jgi:hypothetical protein